MQRIVTFLLAAVSMASVAMADQRGDELLWQCSSKKDTDVMACIGYLSGFMDAIALQAGMSKSEPLFCLPKDGISNDQARRIVVKWLEEHPAMLHESARLHVALALRNAFPCSSR